jgi:hypothetical protein
VIWSWLAAQPVPPEASVPSIAVPIRIGSDQVRPASSLEATNAPISAPTFPGSEVNQFRNTRPVEDWLIIGSRSSPAESCTTRGALHVFALSRLDVRTSRPLGSEWLTPSRATSRIVPSARRKALGKWNRMPVLARAITRSGLVGSSGLLPAAADEDAEDAETAQNAEEADSAATSTTSARRG